MADGLKVDAGSEALFAANGVARSRFGGRAFQPKSDKFFYTRLGTQHYYCAVRGGSRFTPSAPIKEFAIPPVFVSRRYSSE
jgi:hypothetical protein